VISRIVKKVLGGKKILRGGGRGRRVQKKVLLHVGGGKDPDEEYKEESMRLTTLFGEVKKG